MTRYELVRIHDRRMVSLKLMECTDMTVTNCVRALAYITSLEPYDEEYAAALEWLAYALEELLGLASGFMRARSSLRIDTSYPGLRSLAGPENWLERVRAFVLAPRSGSVRRAPQARTSARTSHAATHTACGSDACFVQDEEKWHTTAGHHQRPTSESFTHARPKAHTQPRRTSRASKPFAAPSSASTARPTSAPPSPPHVAPQELALHAKLAALKRASKDAYSLLTHIYAKHPPRAKPHVVPSAVCATNIKKALLNALRDYHPDHNRPMGDHWWYVLCCEITKALNERHDVLRHV
jgi:hypothetical protein